VGIRAWPTVNQAHDLSPTLPHIPRGVRKGIFSSSGPRSGFSAPSIGWYNFTCYLANYFGSYVRNCRIKRFPKKRSIVRHIGHVVIGPNKDMNKVISKGPESLW
jgi:hypothetical protein